MRRRRSDELAAIDEVQPLVDRFNELNHNQKMIFLDMVDPLPAEPEVKPTKKPKKKSGKPAGKSARANGIAAQLNRSLEAGRKVTVANNDDDGNDTNNDANEHCQKQFDGGFVCNEAADANVHHLRGATGYHEFVGSEQAAGASGD